MEVDSLIDLAATALKSNKEMMLVFKGKKPKGFPVGELVCEEPGVKKVYYFDPIKVLRFCQKCKQHEN